MGQTLGFEFDMSCNDSDVTEQSRVCNDSIYWQTWVELSLHVTDIVTVDQSKVWKHQNMELPRNYPTLNGTWLYMRERCNAPYKEINMYFYRSKCGVQANISVAITRTVTDKEIRVLLSQKLWRTKVAISTSVTDWLLLSLLLGRKIIYKCCYHYTVTDTSRRLCDGQLIETFYCST